MPELVRCQNKGTQFITGMLRYRTEIQDAGMQMPEVSISMPMPSYGIFTVRKMDLILRSIERMLQTQLSMARRFKLQVLRRYNVKFSKMRNFTLETP